MTSGGPTTTETTPDAPPAGGEAAARLCPGCGYDLRAATTDRCSECGLALDRAALHESGFPWAHRRRIGRVRAFVRTVWRVTWDSRSIRHELTKPQDPRDAGRFRAWNAIVVAIVLSGAAGLATARYGLERVAVQPFSPLAGFASARAAPLPGYVQDLAVPWSAGATLPPAVPLYLIGLAVYLTGVGRATMRLRSYPAEHQARAQAVALYAAAPLAWLLLAAAAFAAAYALAGSAAGASRAALAGWSRPLRTASRVADWVAVAVAVAAGINVVHRSGEWFTRAHHAGAGRFAGGVAELLARSAVGALVFLGVLPWCVGFVRIVLGSLS